MQAILVSPPDVLDGTGVSEAMLAATRAHPHLLGTQPQGGPPPASPHDFYMRTPISLGTEMRGATPALLGELLRTVGLG